jgi:hypothetical protein
LNTTLVNQGFLLNLGECIDMMIFNSLLNTFNARKIFVSEYIIFNNQN